jgi:hypothetical protein
MNVPGEPGENSEQAFRRERRAQRERAALRYSMMAEYTSALIFWR